MLLLSHIYLEFVYLTQLIVIIIIIYFPIKIQIQLHLFMILLLTIGFSILFFHSALFFLIEGYPLLFSFYEEL